MTAPVGFYRALFENPVLCAGKAVVCPHTDIVVVARFTVVRVQREVAGSVDEGIGAVTVGQDPPKLCVGGSGVCLADVDATGAKAVCRAKQLAGCAAGDGVVTIAYVLKRKFLVL